MQMNDKPIKYIIKSKEKATCKPIVDTDGIDNKDRKTETALRLFGSFKKYAKKYVPLDKIRAEIQETIGRDADQDQL